MLQRFAISLDLTRVVVVVDISLADCGDFRVSRAVHGSVLLYSSTRLANDFGPHHPILLCFEVYCNCSSSHRVVGYNNSVGLYYY